MLDLNRGSEASIISSSSQQGGQGLTVSDMESPASQNVQRKLVYASEPRVSGFFDDISLLCYPLDPDAKAKVDAELDRMVAAIGEYGRRVARP
jgi:hypothetical protein